MRGFLIGASLVGLVAWGALARADGPAQDRKAQRARVFRAAAEQWARLLGARLVVQKGDTDPAKAQQDPEYRQALVLVEELGPVVEALRRKQGDLYAEMVAAGETP